MVENPAWTDLDHQKTALAQRCLELLATRMPSHPAVQDLEARIEMLRERLATIPRQMPGPSLAEAQSAGQAARPNLADVPSPSELRGLQRSVAEARQAHNAAVRVDRLAWQARLREPKVGLQLAIQPPPRPRRWPAGALALLGALGTGLASVAGLGMIAAGASIEPALGTAARLQAAVAVPVLGTVPCDSSAQRPTSSSARQRLLRTALIVLGLAALFAAGAMLWFVHPLLAG